MGFVKVCVTGLATNLKGTIQPCAEAGHAWTPAHTVHAHPLVLVDG